MLYIVTLYRYGHPAGTRVVVGRQPSEEEAAGLFGSAFLGDRDTVKVSDDFDLAAAPGMGQADFRRLLNWMAEQSQVLAHEYQTLRWAQGEEMAGREFGLAVGDVIEAADPHAALQGKKRKVRVQITHFRREEKAGVEELPTGRRKPARPLPPLVYLSAVGRALEHNSADPDGREVDILIFPCSDGPVVKITAEGPVPVARQK